MQRRAQETRERILAAAARIFAAHGYSAGTTNRIAEAADLSIGSLYQYFPNKDAILVELVRLHITDGSDRLGALLTSGLPDGIEARLRLAVDTVIAVHTEDHRLHQVLFEEAPWPADVLAYLHQREEELVAVVAMMLVEDPDVVVADPVLAARLVVTTVESLVHRFVARESATVEPEVLSAEIVRMLVAYLCPAKVPAATR